MFLQKFPVCDENDPGEGPKGAGGNPNVNMDDLVKQLNDQKAEIERLRNKSDTLLDEKKKVQAKLKAFGDLDPTGIQDMMKAFESSEEARLIAEGKIDEVISKRTEKKLLKSQEKIDELTNSITSLQDLSNNWENKYKQTVIENKLRAVAEKSGVIPEAIDDFLYRTSNVFSLSDNNEIESRDSNGNLNTINGKELTPEVFADELKTKAPHLWPRSEGAGANGGTGGSVNKPNPFVKDSPSYSITEQAKMRKSDPSLAAAMQKAAANK